MARTVSEKEHKKRHEVMLEYQKKISPFTPTMRELMLLWGLNTTSSVHATLKYLEDCGLVISKKNGSNHRYFAVNDN